MMNIKLVLCLQIKCMKCGGKSERQERMMDLTVEIEGDIQTLEEALRRFTSTETLDGENKYHCVRLVDFLGASCKLPIISYRTIAFNVI